MTREDAILDALAALDDSLLWAESGIAAPPKQLLRWRTALYTARAKLVKRRPLPADEALARRRETRRLYARKWRAENQERSRAIHKQSDTRKAARAEAAATGEPVKAIYVRWGVALPSDFTSNNA